MSHHRYLQIAVAALLAGAVGMGLGSCKGGDGETSDDGTGDAAAVSDATTDQPADQAAGKGGAGQGGASGVAGSGQGGTGQGGSGQGGSGEAGSGEGGSGEVDSGHIDADFSYDATTKTPWETLPTKCTEAAEKGVTWLASQQQADGSWHGSDRYGQAATGFALTKLQTYALEHGISPFSPAFKYHIHIKKGFTNLFQGVKTSPVAAAFDMNGNKVGAESTISGSYGYTSGLLLMAITAGQGYDQIVNSPGSPVHGFTFETVAQDFVDHIASCQMEGSGWRYTCKGGVDNSVSQFTSLGLEYAQHPDYQFFAKIPPSVFTGLEKWATAVQSPDGGSGYSGPGGSNPYRTGGLLQQFAFLKLPPGDARITKAVDYLNTNYNSIIGGNPVWKMQLWSIMKGLVTQGIDKVGAHDWYQDFCDVLVNEQKADGSWAPVSYDSNAVMATAFALLVLEKAAPAKSY